MKIVKIKSGLGNQMFQYAFAKTLESLTGESVMLDLSQYNIDRLHNGFELSRLFDIDLKEAPKETVELLSTIPNTFIKRIQRKFFTKPTHYIEDETIFNENVFEIQSSCYFEGYWQSEKYFAPIKNKIADIFSFKYPINHSTEQCVSEIDEYTASIHIRRGDYLLGMNKNLNLCTINYYSTAVNLLQSYHTIKKIIVFSDDIPWCKKCLSFKNIELVFADWNNTEDSWQDMYIMSKCKHNIIANSSFSWWGAYLNQNWNKMVIAPEQWNKKQKRNFRIIPTDWTSLPV
ncbi:MAG: alpha-1,2-fucosyltransferase [Treponema sp.]|nr:alpha-1,2-fucosyltransferase [Treponema sp.]